MLPPDLRSSTPRACSSALAGRHDDKLEVGQATHQQATPAPGDEPANQDRCRAPVLILIGADQAAEPLLEAARDLLDGDVDEGCAPPEARSTSARRASSSAESDAENGGFHSQIGARTPA